MEYDDITKQNNSAFFVLASPSTHLVLRLCLGNTSKLRHKGDTMKLFAKLRGRTALSLVTVLGVLLLLGAAALNSYQSSQVAYYNQGVALYKAGQVDQALQAFDKSLDAYRQAQHAGWLERHLLSTPSSELAALADGKKGNLFVMKQQPELAVAAYEESLKLNPGDGSQAGHQTAETNRLNEQALAVKYDLDMLFRKNPSLSQAGNGQQAGQPGNKPAPGNDPSHTPGKANPDDI